MPAHPATIVNQDRGKQRGAALLIMLVILIIGIAAVLIRSLTLSSIKSARQATTAAALAQAKQALLGYAVSDKTRPGELPCPDIDNDGMLIMNDDYSGSICTSLIGRLPWKTLGLPDLRDGSGERLWYALSDPFHANGSAILNSNTQGTLLVYGPDGLTLQTQAGYSAVAVIFSPGGPAGAQSRNTTTQQNDPANYLDIANSRNNALAGGPFIAGSESSTFNDQLLLITTKDLIPLLEKRVAAEAKKSLTAYYTANGYYPWADTIGPSTNYNANYGQNRGWLPKVASTAGTADWPAGYPAQWFFDNQWYTLIYYSVAPSLTSSHSGLMLNVDGLAGRTLFFMPGTYSGTRAIDDLSEYLYDSQNNDNSNDVYITPTSKAQDRNRIYWLSSGSIWNQ